MILNKRGQKRTANELAKEMVFAHGELARHNWEELLPAEYERKITEREAKQIQQAVNNQLDRTFKLLGSPDPTINKDDKE